VELPPTIKVHNVFHVSSIEPYHRSKFLSHRQSPLPPEEVQEEASWEVVMGRIERAVPSGIENIN
jgi:hypothetical protein